MYEVGTPWGHLRERRRPRQANASRHPSDREMPASIPQKGGNVIPQALGPSIPASTPQKRGKPPRGMGPSISAGTLQIGRNAIGGFPASTRISDPQAMCVARKENASGHFRNSVTLANAGRHPSVRYKCRLSPLRRGETSPPRDPGANHPGRHPSDREKCRPAPLKPMETKPLFDVLRSYWRYSLAGGIFQKISYKEEDADTPTGQEGSADFL